MDRFYDSWAIRVTLRPTSVRTTLFENRKCGHCFVLFNLSKSRVSIWQQFIAGLIQWAVFYHVLHRLHLYSRPFVLSDPKCQRRIVILSKRGVLMNRYRVETVSEYVARGGAIMRLKAANAVRDHYPQLATNSEAAFRRIRRWRVLR
jgi:hypothetical protein